MPQSCGLGCERPEPALPGNSLPAFAHHHFALASYSLGDACPVHDTQLLGATALQTGAAHYRMSTPESMWLMASVVTQRAVLSTTLDGDGQASLVVVLVAQAGA